MSVISYLPANPNSPKLFDVEKKRLTQILSPYLELNSIEHFGSTSIEGLAGK